MSEGEFKKRLLEAYENLIDSEWTEADDKLDQENKDSLLKILDEAKKEWREIDEWKNIEKETHIIHVPGAKVTVHDVAELGQYYSRKHQEWFLKWFGSEVKK